MRVEFDIRAPRWWRNWRRRRYYKRHPSPAGTNDFQIFDSILENTELLISLDETHDMTKEYYEHGEEFARIAKEKDSE